MRKIFLLIAFVVAIVYSCKGNRVTSIGVDDDGKTHYINTKEDFDKIVLEASKGNEFIGETIKLTSDLDLKNEEFEGIIYNNGNGFKGTFDGGGKTISGVNISSDKSRVGFISDVRTEGDNTNAVIIKNLTVSGKLVSTGESIGVGGIIGVTSGDYGDIVISNVTSKIDITANSLKGSTSSVGGIVANLQTPAKIYNVTNYGNIETTASHVGGIIGDNSSYSVSSIISNVYNGGNIKTTTTDTGNAFVGGIAGFASVDIHWAVNKGDIIGVGATGGIVGKMPDGNLNLNKKVYKAANFGNVTGIIHTGGIVGNASKYLNIEAAYNVGNIKGAKKNSVGATGGIVGLVGTGTGTTLKYSYNIGSLSGDAAIGSIAGSYSSSSGSYENVYFLNDVTYIINKKTGDTYTGETTLGGVTGYSAGSISSGVILTELKNKSNPNATIWGEKSTTSVNGVTKRPYIIGLE